MGRPTEGPTEAFSVHLDCKPLVVGAATIALVPDGLEVQLKEVSALLTHPIQPFHDGSSHLALINMTLLSLIHLGVRLLGPHLAIPVPVLVGPELDPIQVGP